MAQITVLIWQSNVIYDERASDLFAENLRRYLAGEPLLSLVERERGY